MQSSIRVSGKNGFTIVELLIVIVIIGILAAVTVVAYNTMQDRARFSLMQTDMKSITKGLELYKVDTGNYPNTIGQNGCTSNWCGWDQATGNNFIDGLSPKYMAAIPQLPAVNVREDTYLYQSDGVNYQLIRFKPSGLTSVEIASSMHITTNGYENIAWGYKTNASWW